MTTRVSPVQRLSGDYPRLERSALFTLSLGRIQIVTALDGATEQLGQGVDTVGGLPVPAERAARGFALKLPVYGPGGPINVNAHGRRLRRQLRGMVENDLARLEPLLWVWDADPEMAVWVLVGSGSLEDTGGGANVFADWTLSLSDGVRLGTLATHRAARQLFARPLASGATPRDWKGLVVATDLQAAATLAVHGLPAMGNGMAGPAGAPTLALRSVKLPGNRGGSVVGVAAAGLASASVVDFAADPVLSGVGDVVAVDRRGVLETWAFGGSMTTAYGLTDVVRQRWPAIRSTVRNRNVEKFFAVYGSSACLDSTGGNGGYAYMAQAFVVNNRDPSNSFMRVGEWETILNWNVGDLATLGIEGAPSPTTGNYEPFIKAMRYCISRSRAVAMCPINGTAGTSDAAFSWSGSWTDHLETDKNSGTGWRGTTSGGFTWTSPGNIKPGQTVALNGLTIPANNKLTVTATLVGCGETRTSTFTVDGNTNAGWGSGTLLSPNRYSPWCERFADLVGGGPYTLTVTTSGAVGTGCGFDGVNVEFADPHAPQVTVCTGPQFPGGDAQWAAWFAGWPHQPTVATVNQADQRLQGLVDEFGGPRAGVQMMDYGKQLGTDLALRYGDQVHLSDFGNKRMETAMFECAERSGEDMLGPAHERLSIPTSLDAPVLENGMVRLRPMMGESTDPTDRRATLAVDVPNATYSYWDEIGRIEFAYQTSNGGTWAVPQMLQAAQLVAYSPERSTVRLVIQRSAFDVTTVEVFVTLERGQPQARVEMYSPSGKPGVATGLGLAVRWVPNSTGIQAAASPAAGIAAADPGITWNNSNSTLDVGTWLGFGFEPWVASVDPAAGLPTVTMAMLRGNHYWRCMDTTTAYGGATRRGVQIEAPYGGTAAARGYCAAAFGVLSQKGQLTDATTIRFTGSGTTSNQTDANSRSGTVVRDTQTSDAAATLKIAATTWAPQKMLALARISSTVASSTFSLYHRFFGTGGTISPVASQTPPTSLSGAKYVSLGEATLGTYGSTWELHAWRTAGTGAINIDAVILVPTELRQAPPWGSYDAAGDLCARALLEHRAVPALTSKAA